MIVGRNIGKASGYLQRKDNMYPKDQIMEDQKKDNGTPDQEKPAVAILTSHNGEKVLIVNGGIGGLKTSVYFALTKVHGKGLVVITPEEAAERGIKISVGKTIMELQKFPNPPLIFTPPETRQQKRRKQRQNKKNKQ